VPLHIRLLPISGYTQVAGATPRQMGLIALGGVASLLVVGAILVGSAAFWARQSTFANEPALIGWVRADSPTRRDGLLLGDRILDIDGQSVATWGDLPRAVQPATGTPMRIRVKRGSSTTDLVMQDPPSFRYDVAPPLPPRIARVGRGTPASAAGVRPGDLITMADDRAVVNRLEGEELLLAGHVQRLTIRPALPGSPDILLPVSTVSLRELGLVMEGYAQGRMPAGEAMAKTWNMCTALPRELLSGARAKKRSRGGASSLWKALTWRTPSPDNGLRSLYSPLPFAPPAGVAAWVGYLAIVLGLLNCLPLSTMAGGAMLRGLLWGRIPEKRLAAVEKAIESVFAVLLVVLLVLLTVRDCTAMRSAR
jgi:membrane-associated protease RseP (regulator of RpoE activity)